MKIRVKRKIERLTEKSFVEAVIKRRQCPFFRRDSSGSYCAKSLGQGEEVSDERREICDYPIRMARCLDAEKYRGCMFYTGEVAL